MTNSDKNAADIPPDQIDSLKAAARAAWQNAHAPHSDFPVGAAVLDADGNVHRGCNVENASYGLTVCAERNAVAAAVVAGAKRIRAVAIHAPTEKLTPPCGACRQVLVEFAADDARIVSFNDRGAQKTWRLGDLLPEPFRLDPHGDDPPPGGNVSSGR
jgi:cytidine deaminase